jgi:hypothetical protein
MSINEYNEFAEAVEYIINEAVAMGMDLFEEPSTYDIYNEAVYTGRKADGSHGVSFRDKTWQTNLMTSKLALARAKSKGDADYKKYVQFTKKRKELLARINKKYKSSSTREAKKIVKQMKKSSSMKAPKAVNTSSSVSKAVKKP